jgi:hypothetical protein
MRTLVICASAVIVCLGMLSVVEAQTLPEKAKTAQEILPREACQALETYIANIDAAQSQPDASKRAQRYDAAKAQLEPTLKRYGKTSVLDQAYLYATYTEQVVTKDATDAQLPDAMEKRLNVRAGLLGSCADYTATR